MKSGFVSRASCAATVIRAPQRKTDGVFASIKWIEQKILIL
jgi:hypothetical protein